MDKRFAVALQALERELQEAGRRLAQLEALVETAISDLRDQVDAVAVMGTEADMRLAHLERHLQGRR